MSIASRIESMTEHLTNNWNVVDSLGLYTKKLPKEYTQVDYIESHGEIQEEHIDRNLENLSLPLKDFYNEVSNKTDISQNGVVGRTSQNTDILPTEYTQVDYIESSGSQYIDTGVNADYKLSIKFEFSNLLQNSYQGAMHGSKVTNIIRHHLQMTDTNNVAYWAGLHDSGCSTIIITGTNYDISKKYNIFADIYNQKYYLDGVEISGAFNSNDFDTELNYCLFGRNTSNGVASMLQMKMYSFQMYYENELVRDFIPCYRNSDNEVGLYDLVNGVFYTNQGTGAFTYGSVVSIPNPDYPQPINNLSGDVAYKISGKNLFNPTYEVETQYGINGEVFTTNRYILNNNIISINKSNNNYGNAFFNKIYLSTGTYTFSCDVSQTNNTTSDARLKIQDWTNSSSIVASKSVNISSGKVEQTFEVSSNAEIGIMLIPNQNSDGTLYLSSIQLEENSIATDFEPYIEPQTFNIPLGDIELCKIDTYEDKIYSNNGRFYLDKEIYKNKMLSSYSWYKSNNTNFKFITGSLRPGIVNEKCYCNYYKQENINDVFHGRVDYGVGLAVDKGIAFRNKDIPYDIDAWKTYLDNNDVILYYGLETPTTTEITQENYPALYNALKQIQDYLTAYKINKEFILGYSSPEIEY